MVELVGNIALAGLKIFNEERRRHYEKWYYQLLKMEQEALAATYPNYSDHNLGQVRKELEIFAKAYSAELGEVLNAKNIIG